MAKYYGHRSWNAWNVALYISHEYHIYKQAMSCIERTKNLNLATDLFFKETGLLGTKTPDGAVYNRTSVKEALGSLKE